MSESIWNREIEEGLKSFLNTIIMSSKGEPVKIKVRKPDEDFKDEVYPVIYLQNTSDKFAVNRYDPTNTIISRDTETNTVEVEEAHLPFDCDYKIGFYSLYCSEINLMLQKFLANTHGGRYFNLPVKDQSGNDWDLFVLRKNSGIMSRGYYYDKNTRIYSGTFNFSVHTQLNENIRYTKPMVTVREFTNLNKEGTNEDKKQS